MSELTTKEFNVIYKKNFKEYFDKPLKKDGFYKKGTINFYRLNKLGFLEGLNFQRHYDRVTVNFFITLTCCQAVKDSIGIGGRLGNFTGIEWDYWWNLSDEETIKVSMQKMLKIIQNELYEWFENLEEEKMIIKQNLNQKSCDRIYVYISQATLMAKFKKYNEIIPYIKKVEEEYNSYPQEEKEWDWVKNIMEEALILKEKVKEGHKSIDEYIIWREKETLLELGLEKLLK